MNCILSSPPKILYSIYIINNNFLLAFRRTGASVGPATRTTNDGREFKGLPTNDNNNNSNSNYNDNNNSNSNSNNNNKSGAVLSKSSGEKASKDLAPLSFSTENALV